MQSIGNKGKNVSASQVTEIRKQKVLANLYSQQLPGASTLTNTVKTRGAISVAEVKKFTPDLNAYAEITSGQLR